MSEAIREDCIIKTPVPLDGINIGRIQCRKSLVGNMTLRRAMGNASTWF